MTTADPWIYIDRDGSIWKFYRNENNDLVYSVIKDGERSKESLIDTGVLSFAPCIEEDGRIHIVYGNIIGELKYCTLKDKQWLGKVLYRKKSDEFELYGISALILGEDMHIFYLLAASGESGRAELMHCRWNGKKTAINMLGELQLVPGADEHFAAEAAQDGIHVFFITDEGEGVSFEHLSYRDNGWSSAKRLYGIEGGDVGFDVIAKPGEIHILNNYREGSKYFLEHVFLDTEGIIQHYRVYESESEVSGPMLFIESGRLCACWLNEGGILCSCYRGRKWDEAKEAAASDKPLKKYKCTVYFKEASSRAKAVYAASEPDFSLFIPNQLIKEGADGTNQAPDAAEEDESRGEELARVKEENKNLEKEIAALSMQLRKKQRLIEEYEESLSRMLERKKKVEEDCNAYLELQRNTQKELEGVRLKLSEEQKITAELQKRLKENEEENTRLKVQIGELSEKKKEGRSIINRLLWW